MAKYKEGVVKDGITDKAEHAIRVSDEVHKDVLDRESTVTSVNDGKHMAGSKHYEGNAVDFRTRDMTPTQAEKIKVKMQNSLGKDYDVINEGDHIHVEYDKKG